MRSALIILFACLLSSGGWAQTFLLENFDTGIDTTAGGWTIVDGGTSSDTWFGTQGGSQGSYLDGTEFAFVNSDDAGPGNILLEEQLISPVLNTAGAALLLLEFQHYYRSVVLTDSGFVDVWDGSQWVTIDTMTASRGNFVTPAVELYDISAYANANLQIRFTYDDDSTWAWWWAVDNVRVYSPPSDDASVTEVLSPVGGGRANSSSALTPTETVSAEVVNLGADTLSNVPISFSINGTTIATESVPGPLIPNVPVVYTFTATGSFSGVNNYDLRVFTELTTDADLSNDTAAALVRHLPNLPVFLPFCEDFEAMPDTVFLGEGFALPGVDALDYLASDPTAGRLRTFAGNGFSNSGQRAITLDRSSSGPIVLNEIVLTYNMIAYNAQNDAVTLDLAVMDHGDEVDPGDSVWVRGCDTCDWIALLAWNDITGTDDGQYFLIEDIDLSGPLVLANQNFSTSTQLKIGQQDNFPATSTTASDGFTVDDICLNIELDTNVALMEILTPENGACGDSTAIVTVVVGNTGVDTVANVPIFATVSGASPTLLNGVAPGPIAPGERDTVSFATPINTYLGGNIGLTAYTALAADQLSSDDSLSTTRFINPVPESPTISGDTLTCINTPSTFTVDNPVPGLSYVWYDSSGSNVVHVGNSFTTPPITGPTTYQVEPGGNTPYTVGRPDNSGSGGTYTTYSDGLIFNVFQELTIDSVDVYPNDTGRVFFVLEDGQGNPVVTVSDSVSPAAPGDLVRIPVGVTLTPGSGYRVTADGTTSGGIWRTDAGATFPYSVPNVIEISQTVNGLHTSGYYYFFYNWKITARGCPGNRTTVEVDTSTFVPTTVGFSPTPSGLTVDFAPTTNNAQAFEWDFGDGNTSLLANPSHTYAQPGTYQVCVIGTGPCIADTFCDVVTVTCGAINPDFSFAENGLQLFFTDQSTGGIAWQWDFGDGTGDTTANPTHIFSTDGTYTVCLTVTDACGQQDQFCDSLQVCAPLTADFTYTVNGTSADFTNQSLGNGISFDWDFGDGSTASGPTVSHVFFAGSSWPVTLTVTNLCGDTASTTETVVLVGLEDALLPGVSVAPNPSQGQFSVVVPDGAAATARVVVMDGLGRKVVDEVRSLDAGLRLPVDLRGVARGAYWLRVEMAGRAAVRMLRVE